MFIKNYNTIFFGKKSMCNCINNSIKKVGMGKGVNGACNLLLNSTKCENMILNVLHMYYQNII